MHAVLRRFALLLAPLLLLACASQPPGPYYGDEQYLVFGVRPDAEAAALAEQIVASGYPLTVRLSGQSFTALGFVDEQGLPAKVRVVTVRGAALVLDPEASDLLHGGVRYRLLEAPLQDTQDADGDGFEEVFVEQQPESGEPPCIMIYRVRDSGFVDRVPGKGYALARETDVREGSWLDPTFCEDEPEAEAEETGVAPATDDGAPQTSGGEDTPATPAPVSNGAAPAAPAAQDPPAATSAPSEKPSVSPAAR
jgi:hypothetical protein